MKHYSRSAKLRYALVMLFACGVPPHRAHHAGPVLDLLTLAESVPLETSLDHAEIPNAPDVWLDMIRGATRTIDIATFYVSDEPGSRLHAVLGEIERAAVRGVHVRLLVDETFYAKYPEIPDAWSRVHNIETRRYDLRPGVLHAKYFVVDDRDAFLGSQNFDWRALEHIVEMGARIRSPNVAHALGAIFRADWDAAGGAPFHLDDVRVVDSLDGGDLMLGASPKKLVPESMWELPRLLDWINGTTWMLRVQLLTYKTKNRDGTEFHEIDDALRAAAARGVHVKLLISTWGEKDEAIVLLSRVPNIEVRALAIPAFSGGDIPFARVSHAKYALFGEGRAWVGTSNWEGDYFYSSRNVSVFMERYGDIGALVRAFESEWTGPYARPLK